ncbi:MAG: hypothetical protein AB1758_03450 [Candidatus Eremiobacterota bacterium]
MTTRRRFLAMALALGLLGPAAAQPGGRATLRVHNDTNATIQIAIMDPATGTDLGLVEVPPAQARDFFNRLSMGRLRLTVYAPRVRPQPQPYETTLWVSGPSVYSMRVQPSNFNLGTMFDASGSAGIQPQAASPAGLWRWHVGNPVEIRGNLTVQQDQGPGGTWEWLQDGTFVIHWDHGYTDHLAITHQGAWVEGWSWKNSEPERRFQINGRRLR